MGKRVILALDISSSSTGYAVLINGRWYANSKYYGYIKIPTENKKLPERLSLFREELKEIIAKVAPTDIVIEDVFNGRNVKTMKLLARFNGVALELSRKLLKKDPSLFLASAVRAGLGCGRGKKEAFEFICKKYKLDWPFTKNDITDAVALALHAHSVLKGIS